MGSETQYEPTRRRQGLEGTARLGTARHGLDITMNERIKNVAQVKDAKKERKGIERKSPLCRYGIIHASYLDRMALRCDLLRRARAFLGSPVVPIMVSDLLGAVMSLSSFGSQLGKDSRIYRISCIWIRITLLDKNSWCW